MALNFNSFASAGFSQFATSTLPVIITSVLVIGLASTIATITWQTLPSDSRVAPPLLVDSGKIAASNSTSNANKVNKQIPNWHLFGVTQKKAPPKPVVRAPVAQEAPDTQLRLTLKGVVSSGNAIDAWAIIADRMGNEDSYGIESSLPGGATLKEIYADRIILLHNGRLETLRLPKTDISGAKKPSKRRASSRNARANKRSENRNARTMQRSSGNVKHVSAAGSAVLKDYRDKLMSDPQSVMNSVRAEPYRQAGKLKGYRIFPGRDKNLFGQLGLEPGDIVTSVNGIAMDSPLRGLEVMQNITEASEVSVEVLRNGVSQTFVVPMN